LRLAAARARRPVASGCPHQVEKIWLACPYSIASAVPDKKLNKIQVLWLNELFRGWAICSEFDRLLDGFPTRLTADI
jgi:hypothetical protein